MTYTPDSIEDRVGQVDGAGRHFDADAAGEIAGIDEVDVLDAFRVAQRRFVGPDDDVVAIADGDRANLAGVRGLAAIFSRHETSFSGVRRISLMAACSSVACAVDASALKDGAAAINAVAAAPIMAVLRTLDTVVTRDLLGNPFVIRTSPDVDRSRSVRRACAPVAFTAWQSRRCTHALL